MIGNREVSLQMSTSLFIIPIILSVFKVINYPLQRAISISTVVFAVVATKGLKVSMPFNG